MDDQRSVLIVDRSEETREVLQTVLERHGVRTLSAGHSAAGLELARQHHPDLIVLDLELDDVDRCAAELAADWPQNTPARQYQPHLVLLGNLRRWRDRAQGGEFVPKPYHYGPLIRKIEELLAHEQQGNRPCQRSSSSAAPTKAPALN
jgi:CheY-like chemotaxis protein